MKATKFKKAPICEICTARIHSYGFICLDLMDRICSSSLNLNVCYYDEKSLKHTGQVIRFLELKGLLVTRDIQEGKITVMPNLSRCHFNGEDETFCWCDYC